MKNQLKHPDKLLRLLSDIGRQEVPDKQWKKQLRKQLMSEIAKEYSGSFNISLAYQMFRLPALAFASVLLFSTAAFILSSRSLPGQNLYPLKRFMEEAQLELISQSGEKKLIQAQFSQTRIEELEQALDLDDSGSQNQAAEEVVEALELLYSQEDEATVPYIKAIEAKLDGLENKYQGTAKAAVIQTIKTSIKKPQEVIPVEEDSLAPFPSVVIPTPTDIVPSPTVRLYKPSPTPQKNTENQQSILPEATVVISSPTPTTVIFQASPTVISIPVTKTPVKSDKLPVSIQGMQQ